MERNRNREKLLKIIERAPAIKEIMLSPEPLEVKRKKVRTFLSDRLMATFDNDPSIHSLEWVLTRDAIGVLKNILSTRNERIAGFSFLRYVNDLIHSGKVDDFEKPSAGFFAELEHLFRGIMGETKVYTEKVPAFLKYEGIRAAKLRSSDLSRLARTAQRFIDRYPSGLEGEVLSRRERNKDRILEYFQGTEEDWEDWKWHTRHIIRDADTLSSLIELPPAQYEAVKTARKNKIPFGITPYYLSLMDFKVGSKHDAAVRAQVIPSLHYVRTMMKIRESNERSMDFMLERDTSPVEGITRRYPMIVILKPVLTCPQICVYCQRNWEIEDVYSHHAAITKEKLDRALRWIAKTPEIKEVLVTGGDPLLLSDEKIEYILHNVSEINHVERIRIGSRIPVTLPQRVTDSLVDKIAEVHEPGRREVVFVSHYEHTYEVTPQSMAAVQKFRQHGIGVYNQLVYTFFNSRKFEAVALRLKLRLIGVSPYYTFDTKGKDETNEYRVPIARLLQEQKEEARLLPGTVRTDEIVFNVPRLGKNYLRAVQHHDVISLFPDGRRVYEFHPWEKKLSLVDTFVYTDVSIYEYLQRLKRRGEDLSDYRTIWYYY
ncbi:MAG: KamA family radical SAM protein [Deltaproteobacteria bacterium]|nr:KamA family radical SAM protein [Deltaproteobacteria bacterium]